MRKPISVDQAIRVLDEWQKAESQVHILLKTGYADCEFRGFIRGFLGDPTLNKVLITTESNSDLNPFKASNKFTVSLADAVTTFNNSVEISPELNNSLTEDFTESLDVTFTKDVFCLFFRLGHEFSNIEELGI